MTEYSPRSRELARELRAKAIGNLRSAGYTVRQSSTGRFVTSRDGNTGSRDTVGKNTASRDVAPRD